jgi:hypothetical protein
VAVNVRLSGGEEARPRGWSPAAGLKHLRELPALAQSGRTEARASRALVQERAQKEAATGGGDHRGRNCSGSMTSQPRELGWQDDASADAGHTTSRYRLVRDRKG